MAKKYGSGPHFGPEAFPFGGGQLPRVGAQHCCDIKIHMHENIAVLTAAYHERGELGGKSYDYHDRLTDVWMKIGGKWQLIASHYSLPSSI
jgi:ketosteroid isomerase-like protein